MARRTCLDVGRRDDGVGRAAGDWRGVAPVIELDRLRTGRVGDTCCFQVCQARHRYRQPRPHGRPLRLGVRDRRQRHWRSGRRRQHQAGAVVFDLSSLAEKSLRALDGRRECRRDDAA